MPPPDAMPGAGAPNLGAMMGGAPAPDNAPSPNAREQAKDSLREFSIGVTSLADQIVAFGRKYPEFSESARAIQEAVKAGITKVMANQLRSLEGPPPPTAAV